jgi:carbon storage regulator CsrA
MLVLTRKRHEQIRIGDSITLTILRIKGNTVRVGIEAPRGVRVMRGELPTRDSLEHAEIVKIAGLPRVKRPSDESSSADRSRSIDGDADSNRFHQLVQGVTDPSAAVANAL